MECKNMDCGRLSALRAGPLKIRSIEFAEACLGQATGLPGREADRRIGPTTQRNQAQLTPRRRGEGDHTRSKRRRSVCLIRACGARQCPLTLGRSSGGAPAPIGRRQSDTGSPPHNVAGPQHAVPRPPSYLARPASQYVTSTSRATCERSQDLRDGHNLVVSRPAVASQGAGCTRNGGALISLTYRSTRMRFTDVALDASTKRPDSCRDGKLEPGLTNLSTTDSSSERR